MKYLLLIILLANTTVLIAQEEFLSFDPQQNTILISSDYEHSKASPILIAGFQRFAYQGDSIYLVNQERMTFYRQLHQAALDSIDYPAILESYQGYVLSQDTLLKEIKVALSKYETIVSSIIVQGDSEIARINQELMTTTNLLANARNQVERMDKLYKKSTKGNLGGVLKTFFAASLGATLAILVLK